MSLSIIIPLFNEEKNIEPLVNEIIDCKKKINEVFEIILINDSSTDKTLEKIIYLQKSKIENLTIINNKTNLGQSRSLYIGIMQSKYETIISLDGDGQNNPNDIPKLLDFYRSMPNISLVGGLRMNRKDSFTKKISSKLANKIRRFILDDDCIDTGCSLKVFDKSVFLSLPYFNGIHRFLPALYKGFGNKTYFTEVDHRPRNFGKSNYGTLLRLYQGIIDIIKVLFIIKKNNYKND